MKIKKGIPIDALIFPLRYDVEVRQAFLDFYRENAALHESNLTQFCIEAKRQSLYFFQFEQVKYGRPGRKALDDVSIAFEQAVQGFIKLYHSIITDGWDERFPIGISAPRFVQSTLQGKKVPNRYFVGDGCHRLAILRSQGQEMLQPHQFRLHRPLFFQPRDNTYIYTSRDAITFQEYLSFFQSRVGFPKRVNDLPALLHWLEEQEGSEAGRRDGYRYMAHCARTDWAHLGLSTRQVSPPSGADGCGGRW